MKALILSNEDSEVRGGSTIGFYQNIIASLAQSGLDAEHQYVRAADWLRDKVNARQHDIVYSGAYYTEDGENIHAVLEQEDMPYIGSTPETLELVLSKSGMKKVWQEQGVNTPEFFTVLEGNKDCLEGDLDFPFIVKPSREGMSRGMDEGSVVYDRDALMNQVDKLIGMGYDDILVEQYLGRDVREFTVGTLGEKDKIMMPAELLCRDAQRPLFVGNETKEAQDSPTRTIYPGPLARGEMFDRVTEFARSMADAAGTRDYCRCDVICAGGKLYAIEINGQSQIGSYYLTGALAIGMDEMQCHNALFLAGIARNGLDIPDGMRKTVPAEIYARLTGE